MVIILLQEGGNIKVAVAYVLRAAEEEKEKLRRQ